MEKILAYFWKSCPKPKAFTRTLMKEYREECYTVVFHETVILRDQFAKIAYFSM